ncbi:MAG TPA: ABC transporter substrate-binding protein [Polyangia bacterium]|jgi:glucose/mannose transport system substrate-binding protein
MRLRSCPAPVATPAALVALAVVLSLAAACGRPSPAEPHEEGGTARPIEISTWWQKAGPSAGELDPLSRLLAIHRKRFPNDLVIQAGAGLSELKRKTLHARMLRNDPPDTFEANAGGDLLQWVLYDRADASQSRLLPLDDLVEGVADWRRRVPPAILDQVSQGGKTYGVPVNVYRVNTIFYNKRVFRRFGLDEPKSVADLSEMERKLRGSGVPLIALGSREPWTLALLTFECLLVAREGRAFYVDYFRGRVAADDMRMQRTLEAALALGPFFNADHQRLSWSEAVDRVADGQAAMTIMGDWAQAEFNGRGMVQTVDFGEIPFPGSEQSFVFTADTYALPVGAKNQAGARRLLATMGTREAQHAMNDGRGALSARLDVPAPSAMAISLANHDLLERGSLVLALSGLVPPPYAADVAASLSEMLAEHDIEPVLHTLRSRQVLLH